VSDVAALRTVAVTITRELGIRMPEAKLDMLRNRLDRRMRELGISSLHDYAERLRDPSRVELVQLFDLATTNKTDFFRERAHFDDLTRRVLPELQRAHPSAWTCRVWCAGCSTGQEPYTLAMVLDDYARGHPGFAYTIHGTDISTRVLREAVAATYDEQLVEPVPATWRQRYLMRSRDRERKLVRIVPELRRRVDFSRLNFMDEAYAVPGPFDLVFFRNVMIYFDRATQQQVVDRQCAQLRAGGYLYIGHTESLSGLNLPLEPVSSSVWRRR
jgi:chemotaxis protein methyltransferase CheR